MKSLALACRAPFFNFHHFFLYSFKSPWLPFLPESRVLELSGLFSNRSPLLTYSQGGLPLKGLRLEEKPKGKPDTSCETLDISVVLSFTFPSVMEEHSLQNSPSLPGAHHTPSPSQFILTSLPHPVLFSASLPLFPVSLSQKFTSGRSSQTSIPKKPLLSPL